MTNAILQERSTICPLVPSYPLRGSERTWWIEGAMCIPQRLFLQSLAAAIGGNVCVMQRPLLRQCLTLTKILLLDCIAPISAVIGTSPSGTSGTVRLN